MPEVGPFVTPAELLAEAGAPSVVGYISLDIEGDELEFVIRAVLITGGYGPKNILRRDCLKILNPIFQQC